MKTELQPNPSDVPAGAAVAQAMKGWELESICGSFSSKLSTLAMVARLTCETHPGEPHSNMFMHLDVALAIEDLVEEFNALQYVVVHGAPREVAP